MPQLGETVTEGTVTRWLKAEGDEVGIDEPLLEVSTDKVETEIPSAFAGVVRRIVVGEGDTVPIGSLLAIVGGEEGDDELGSDDLGGGGEIEPARHDPTVASARAFRAEMEGGQGYLHAPVHRSGRHRRPDRVGGANGRTDAPAPATNGSARPAPPRAAIDEREVAERIPFSAIRRRTAANLTASLQTAAHTLTVVEVDYTAVDAARAAHGPAWRERNGFGLSYLPFIARAVCAGLARFGRLNASVDGDELVRHRHVNLGVAVDLDFEGLIVPVIHHAEAMRTEAIAKTLHDLAGRARDHHLSGDDIAGGTFTLTNAGAYGTALTVPIINPPQVAILSTDGIAPRPTAVPDPDGGFAVAVRPTGHLSLSFDHRANDGAYASAFLDFVRRELQTRDWRAEPSGPGAPGAWGSGAGTAR